MSNRKEEERNEKIIRGLLKLPPNRRCINCNSLGPQYVCTNFWTFICIACSGVHREFTHRVKSISMAKFTTPEVEALQRGGNQRAKEQFLKEWDTQGLRHPDNSNPDKIREFIRNVYVEKKYAGGRSSDKPPRDTQSQKGHEDHRRASSYHSFSQSPPYDQQYEERRTGKQTGMLTRKPGSDRGYYYEGKYSPGHLGEQMYEDRFANEGSRKSDFSVSSAGDPFRSGIQSPNTNDEYIASPPQVRDIFVEESHPKTLNPPSDSQIRGGADKIAITHRTASSGSLGSLSPKSGNSGSLIDTAHESKNIAGAYQTDQSTFSSLAQSSSAHATHQDLFGPPFVQTPNTNLASSIDLFAESSHHLPSLSGPPEQKAQVPPVPQNGGWANFDFPNNVGPSVEANNGLSSLLPPSEIASTGKIDLFSSMHNNFDFEPVQGSKNHSTVMGDQWNAGFSEVNGSAMTGNSQLWNAFDAPAGSIPQTTFEILPQNSNLHEVLHHSHVPAEPNININPVEVPFKGGSLGSVFDDKALSYTADPGLAALFPSSFPPQAGAPKSEMKSMNPFDLPNDLDPEVNNLFMNVSSLQDALPDAQLPNTFLGGLHDPWFPQNSLTSFIPSVPQGGLAFMGSQVPSSQLSSMPTKDPIAPLGGNPFA